MSSPVGQFLETVLLSGIIEVDWGHADFHWNMLQCCNDNFFFVILAYIELIILVTFLATSNHKAFLADRKARWTGENPACESFRVFMDIKLQALH